MAVTLRVPEALRRYSGGLPEVPAEGGTVGEALEAAFRAHPGLRTRVLDERGRLRPHLLLFLNDAELDRAGAPATPVSDGDVLDLIAAAEGG